MCRNNRRARMNASNDYGSVNNSTMPHSDLNLVSIIGALQQVRLGTSGVQPTGQLPRVSPASELEGQTRGVVYPDVRNEKDLEARQYEEPDFEELPTYEEVAQSRSQARHSQAAMPVMAEPIRNTTRGPSSNAELIRSGLEHFNAGLEQYRQGACGGRGTAKRAARAFMRDLYEQEMENRRSEQGHLVIGDRKQIRRELKPVKQMMKEAVWEATKDRRGHR